jgi:hypothetical protein
MQPKNQLKISVMKPWSSAYYFETYNQWKRVLIAIHANLDLCTSISGL